MSCFTVKKSVYLQITTLFLPFQEQIGITGAQQVMKNILNIILHGCFSGLEFPCLPIVLVSGFKGTLRQCPNGQPKVLNEMFSMAQKPLNTLAHRKNIQRWKSKDVKQFLCQSVKHAAAWYCVRVIKHFQQGGKKSYNL